MEDSVTQDLGVDDLAEHSVIGRYRVVQRLGEGGMEAHFCTSAVFCHKARSTRFMNDSARA